MNSNVLQTPRVCDTGVRMLLGFNTNLNQTSRIRLVDADDEITCPETQSEISL